jgi:hypothetical protein
MKMRVDLAQEAKTHIRTLFDELRVSVTNKDLHVQNSTRTFFKNFYPIIYQDIVTKKKLPGEFAECLKDKVLVIKPFKDVPQKMTTFLIKMLLPVQQFLRSLQTIGHVLDAADNVELSDGCKSALVKMSYCSLCDGFSDVKPCPRYCLNVVSSCVVPYTEIEDTWSSFIQDLDNFRELLAKSLDASVMFARLQKLLSESRSHASHSKVAQKVRRVYDSEKVSKSPMNVKIKQKKTTCFSVVSLPRFLTRANVHSITYKALSLSLGIETTKNLEGILMYLSKEYI